jgi:hypothetical protein
MLLDLENVSRCTRDIIKRSALTVPWRGGFEMGVEQEPFSTASTGRGNLAADATIEMNVLQLKLAKLYSVASVEKHILLSHQAPSAMYGVDYDETDFAEDDGDREEDPLVAEHSSVRRSKPVASFGGVQSHCSGLQSKIFKGGVFACMLSISEVLPDNTVTDESNPLFRSRRMGQFFVMREVALRKWHRMATINHQAEWKNTIVSSADAIAAYDRKEASPNAKTHKKQHKCAAPSCTKTQAH